MRHLFVILVLGIRSCVPPDSEGVFFDTTTMEYDEVLEQGFKRVPVDVYRVEKEFGAVILALEYTDNLKDLHTKNWLFNRNLQKGSLDSLVYGNDMNYLTNPCEVDKIRSDFYLIDRKNRIFVGHSFDQTDESYTVITYYIPKK